MNIIKSLFTNSDEPIPPDRYWPDTPLWLRKILWWFRNPAHDFTTYVMGLKNRPNRKVYGEYPGDVSPEKGWNRCFHTLNDGFMIFPFVAYTSKNWKFYIGWRPPNGGFGIKIQKK